MFIVTKQIDSENISKLCRTCLREDGDKMVCLFVGPAGSSLAAKLRSLSCLEVWQGDGLPEKLCDRCVTRAESALLFREQCRAADRALRQAASKVSGLTTYTTVSGCKLYEENQGFTPIETSGKTLKCVECGAVFMNYQELCVHSRLHAPFVHESTLMQHMHIVESNNQFFTTESSINDPVIEDNRNASVAVLEAPKTDRPACALHCSLCNHTFPNRNQLINHNFTHCNDNVDTSCDNDSIEIAEDSTEIAENLTFHQYPREPEDHQTIINNMTYPENLSIPQSQRIPPEIINSESDLPDISTSNGTLTYSKFTDDKRTHKCSICDKTFSQKSKLKTHELSHTGQRPFKCRDCHKAYASKSKLNAHVRLHTRTDLHDCKICDKIFSYPSYLKEHMKIHNVGNKKEVTVKAKKFECSICCKQFRMKKNLKAHLKLHSGEGLFHCEICSKIFSQKYNLKTHMKTHKGVKLHKCEYCSKSFAEKGNYTEHLRIHTKVKPFSCKMCGKSFAQSSHLKSHEATHDSKRPHQCTLCGKRFKLLSHLKRHTNSHSSIKSFKCNQCDQMFSQAFSLKRHLKRHSEI
ncbi:zinc finger protein 573 [Diachasma alloeum]|uniref:zinc finger protein 573 n=1 Tax=Diachasma alloeum TaxID=454923 RepID=UPI00073837D9|nr:zinc finger protein 573 [Diachasma alloeum]